VAISVDAEKPSSKARHLSYLKLLAAEWKIAISTGSTTDSEALPQSENPEDFASPMRRIYLPRNPNLQKAVT